jgi:division/cell wall cluster transcriptional repressor MraZ
VASKSGLPSTRRSLRKPRPAATHGAISSGNAQSVEKDNQGRITLDRKLMAHASLAKEVYVVGVRNRLEIWDQATWDGREEARARARKEQLSQLPERRARQEAGG